MTVTRAGRSTAAVAVVSIVIHAPFSVRILAVKPSSAVHSCTRPSASRRSVIVVRIPAEASTITPNDQRKKSMLWLAYARTQPPPSEASNTQPNGRDALRQTLAKALHWTCSTVPTAPSSTRAWSLFRTG
jgi:hypothetical protein